jgi:AcrR family transcriptional regulator
MSPRTAKQFKEIREEKKNLIMDVALECFAKEGFHNTTITHIARKAGISKGLMYNYFESKEQLLSEIINRSMAEILCYFDPDKDGFLTEDEFELFIRKLFSIIRNKLSFWRLFYQFIMQKDVRDQFLKSYFGPARSIQGIATDAVNTPLANLGRIITDYFIRKKDTKPADYNPILEMNMLLYTIEGFALISTFVEEIDDNYFDQTINRIIEIYK